MQGALHKHGKDIYGTKLPIYFEAWLIGQQSALPTYLVSLAICFLGCNIVAVRLPILIISIISIFVIYLFSKEIFNKRIAILVLFLTAINPWHIMQSQWNLDCNLFPHLILIAIYLLCSGIINNNKIKLYFSMVVFGLCMYSYGISIYFVPIFLILTGIVLLIKKKISIKQAVISSLIYILITIPILIMYLINYLQLDTIEMFGFTIQRFYLTNRNEDMLIFSNNILEQLKINCIYLFKTVILQYDGFKWNGILGFGTCYIFSIIFIVFGITALLNKEKMNEFSFIFLLWIIVSFIIGISIKEININRLNIIWYPMIIINGYGIHTIWKILKSKSFILSIIIGIYVFTFIIFTIRYYCKYQKEISYTYTFSKGLVNAIEYVKDNKKGVVVVSKDINELLNYIYYLYLSDINFISRGEIYKYYLEKHEFYGNEIILENFNEIRMINNGIYLIKNKQRSNIQNINEYTQHEFGDYVVLTK